MGERLAGKIAIVTGAGSRGPGVGNGKAAAILMAREGARVLCVDAQKDRAEETVGLIRAEQGEAVGLRRRRHAQDGLRARWPRHRPLGGLDVLHNNVGIESRQMLVDLSEASGIVSWTLI